MQFDQLLPVTFYEDTVVLVDHNNEPYVAMKPVVENMGLNWKSQYDKLTAKFGATMVIITTVAEDGKQREMVCLPLRKFPAWLYSITPNKLAPELRVKVVRYQDECDDALWNYWTTGVAVRAGAMQLTVPHMLSTQRQVNSLMQALKRETSPAIRRNLHAQLEQACRLLSLPVPGLDDIGADAMADHESPALAEFWEILDLLRHAASNKLDHSRNTSLIAINLPEVRAAASAAKLTLPDMCEVRRVLKSSRSPEFVGFKTVNSRHSGSRSIKCWVFKTTE